MTIHLNKYYYLSKFNKKTRYNQAIHYTMRGLINRLRIVKNSYNRLKEIM